jgi:hypothetical protein
MRRKDNFKEVNNLGKMLTEMKRLTLENYILPEEDDSFERDDSFEEEMPRDEFNDVHKEENKNDVSGIEKELTQIRKIALSVINRLADQPTSPQYDTMKKIWNMVDKAIEQPQKENNNYSN